MSQSHQLEHNCFRCGLVWLHVFSEKKKSPKWNVQVWLWLLNNIYTDTEGIWTLVFQRYSGSDFAWTKSQFKPPRCSGSAEKVWLNTKKMCKQRGFLCKAFKRKLGVFFLTNRCLDFWHQWHVFKTFFFTSCLRWHIQREIPTRRIFNI